jgi:hypothetical protein
MTVARIYTTQGAAIETRRIIGKLESSAKIGTKAGGGSRITVQSTWDGKNAPPIGWTCHDVRLISKDASNWATEITTQVITDSADGTHRARCTTAELVILDDAVTNRVTLDGTWATANRISDKLLRVYLCLGFGQSNAVGQFQIGSANQLAFLAALNPGALVVFGAGAAGGTPITDAIRGAFGDGLNYATTQISPALVTLDAAAPTTVPLHILCNQGEYEAAGNTSTGPSGTVDFSNWATTFAQVIADIRAQVSAARPFILHIFKLNPNQNFPPTDHLTAIRTQQDSAASGYSDANGGVGLTYNMDDITPDAPPHYSDPHYVLMNQRGAAQVIANQA